jgi:formylglycine-generating enzyme required for sulfatase activity
MNGGNITKNTRGSGAGVYVTGTFIMNGGVIGGSAADKNDATYTYGGGVYIATSNGRFTMNGGEISYNNATDGGGVVINTDAVFTMNGGVIKSNMASTDGAGIFNTGAAFNISGNAQVSVDNEVFLASGKTITVTGPLDHTLMVTLNSPANNTPVLTLPSDFLPAWFAGKIEFTHGETYSVDSDGKLVTPDLVTEFSLDGKVTAPVKGATPVTTGTGSNQYDVSMVVWKNNDDSTFTGTYFLPDTAYKAVVTLTAKSGYTFNGVATGSFTYTGVSVAHLAGTGTSLSVTITFLKTADFASPHRDMISVTGDTVTGTDSSGVFPSGRTVTINNFKIAKYEVTYQLWKEVYDWAIDTDRGVNQYTFAHTGSGNEANQTRPVGNTGWRDAIVWCNAYSELSGKEPVYAYGGNTIRDSTAATCDSAIMDMTKTGYRLPTEAEWEYAARGGPPVSPYWSYAYAGSATADDVAWHAGNADNYVHPVGTKDPNSRGLYDMSGNVWEYCWDRYGSIGSEIVTDPTGPTSGATSNRVRRGGSYTQYASQCTVDSHNDQAWIPPATHSDVGTGFRVVCK